jgi:hypothetical protein
MKRKNLQPLVHQMVPSKGAARKSVQNGSVVAIELKNAGNGGIEVTN